MSGKGGGAGSVCVEGEGDATDGLVVPAAHNAVGRIEVVGCAVITGNPALHLYRPHREETPAIDRTVNGLPVVRGAVVPCGSSCIRFGQPMTRVPSDCA